MEIDPDRATAEYTDRTLAPIREIFPPEIVRVMEEQLAGPCTAEVAAFEARGVRVVLAASQERSTHTA